MFPFEEIQSCDGRYRSFSSQIDNDELIWHRDDEDRTIQVIESDGWYFQRDDHLPIEMKIGDIIHIPKHQWHRVIKKKESKLIVLIKKS